MTEKSTAPDAFDRLEPYRDRRFVPADADLTDRDTLVGLCRRLLDAEIDSAEALTGWLADLGEFEAAAAQAGAVLYVRMTCQTDDEQRAEAFKRFVEQVEPAIKPLADKLNRKFLAARDAHRNGPDRYDLYEKCLRTDVELFRDENVPIETELALLSQKYQTLCGAMMVEFEGQQRTLAAMARYQQQTDRDLRQRAWRATAERRLAERDALEEIFETMLELRGRLAKNTGMASYRELRFASLHRFDYGPAECLAYHEAIEKTVTPLWRKVLEKRRRRMGLDALRPWDLSVDPEGRDPLSPFETCDELIAGVQRIFNRLDDELGEKFAMMDSLGLLDLDSRKGKAPGGYQTTMAEARKPFIFMNAVGLDRDVRTLLHEGGHAFHSLAAADEPLFAYRHGPMEFCEVASMSMELMANTAMDEFYDAGQLHRSIETQLEDVIMILGWVATIDAFQHWLYTHPGHTREQRRDAWLATWRRFDGGVTDWSGLEDFQACRWHAQLHLFEVPFYYIEYGIAQLGALQLWALARNNQAEALAGYKRALALGGSKPLGDLFAAAGIRFDFSEETIAPLATMVADEIAL